MVIRGVRLDGSILGKQQEFLVKSSIGETSDYQHRIAI